ncbi:MAG TPA: xanthine dehydrogenase family protein molybdopterin-binding subunit [Burkholderiales bacterium]|jgi:carbon-monoxide dehydrogenase large subunit|nr:xanthine dehydrogenase family protein molybdopterin-binding subunit [Burkholderiales bacterium]
MAANSLQVQFDPASARFGAARSQKRLEDDRLLAGKGLFSDDREFPDQAWLVLVRSPHAHAKIARVDLSEVRRQKGVVAAWSMADLRTDGVGHIPFPPAFKRADGSPMAAPPRTPLAELKVYYVGQPVIAVVAKSRNQAQDAAELAVVEYEELPSVVDARAAVARGAPLVWDEAGGNIAAEASYGEPEQVAKAFAAAVHVTELELHNQRVIAMAMEPRACIGVLDGARTTLYTQNQTPTGARELLGAVFKRKPEEFRVVNGDIGGGFGMKTGLTPEDALVCYAARKLGRPVRWRGERSEEFLAAHMGRDQHVTASLALDREGRILALRTVALANIGAVPVGSSAIIPLQLTPKVQTTVYRVPAVHYRVQAVLTHTMATGAYRGAGRPEANFLMERLMEKAAREMKLDPVELRRRNFIGPTEFPHRTHLGDLYDSGDFARMLEHALDAADANGFEKRKNESKAKGKLRGRGVSVYLEWTGAIPTETVDIEVQADGTVTVFSGTQAMGQGLETSYSQLVNELLGIEVAKIRIVQGDTDRATGVGSVGSRSAFVGGSALVAAGRKMIARGRELAAEVLEAAASDLDFRDGRFSIAGTDRSIALAEIAEAQERKIIRVSATETPSTPSWPNGAQVVEVEVDPETGETVLARIASCDDIGRIINYPIVEGQVHGGIAQGAGQALFEAACYDRDSGQLLSGSLMDYCVPRADQFPPMHATFDESVPCRTNLLGVKGCGELGTIGAAPAVVHAVLDALHERGVLHLEMPLTPEKVWRALRRT